MHLSCCCTPDITVSLCILKANCQKVQSSPGQTSSALTVQFVLAWDLCHIELYMTKTGDNSMFGGKHLFVPLSCACLVREGSTACHTCQTGVCMLVQESVEASRDWFMACEAYAGRMAAQLATHTMQLPSFEAQQPLLYLVNAILFAGCASGWNLAPESQAGPPASIHLCKFCLPRPVIPCDSPREGRAMGDLSASIMDVHDFVLFSCWGSLSCVLHFVISAFAPLHWVWECMHAAGRAGLLLAIESACMARGMASALIGLPIKYIVCPATFCTEVLRCGMKTTELLNKTLHAPRVFWC